MSNYFTYIISLARSERLRSLTHTLLPATVAISFIVIFGLMSVWNDQRPDLYSSVVSDWDDSIARLGLEPVYPPQEDIVVGDIYFTVIKDNASKNSSNPSLVGRSIKVDHIDVSEEIKKYMNNIYSFPDTIDRPDSNDKFWRQGQYNSSMFASQRERDSLPLVLFPGISIARTREASGSLTSAWKFIALRLGWTRSEQTNIDLKIPAAETYGITSFAASKQLAIYCFAKETRLNCSDQAVRNQLSMVAGDDIYQKVPNSDEPRYDVDIALVNRVYMTRAIDSVTDNRDSYSGQISTEVDSQSGLLRELETDIDKLDISSSEVHEPTTDSDGKERAKLLAKTKALVSALANTKTTDGRKVVATQTFERPVVIGLRAVRTGPITTEEIRR